MRLEYSLLLLPFLAWRSLVCFSRFSLSVLSIVKISGTFCLASLTQTTFLKYFGHFFFTSQRNYSLVFVHQSSPLDCELCRVQENVLLSFLSLHLLPQKVLCKAPVVSESLLTYIYNIGAASKSISLLKALNRRIHGWELDDLFFFWESDDLTGKRVGLYKEYNL